MLEVSGGTVGLGSGRELVTVRLSVADYDQVEALVHAQAAGDVTLIRAPVDTDARTVGRSYRPGADARAG